MGDQIRERVRDAQLLWANQRRESALLLALVAVAAVARDRYPEAGDREAFVRVLTDARSVRLSVEFRSQLEPIEKLLYKWVRCELVHRGGLPLDVENADALGEGLVVRAGGAPEHTVLLPPGWFAHLVGIAERHARGGQ
jgi:hypothetical protein